jgi:aquaglyceroporin related protein
MDITKPVVEGIDISEDLNVSLRTSSKHDALLGVSNASGTTVEEQPPLRWSRIRATCREAFSEFFGTLILILFGNGVVAQVTLSRNQKGDYQSISWGWGSVFLSYLLTPSDCAHI